MKNLIGAKQVGEDTRKTYYATENFFNKVTDAMLRIGLDFLRADSQQSGKISYMGMSSVNS